MFLGMATILVMYYQYKFHWDSVQIGIFSSAMGVMLMLGQGILIRPILNHTSERKAVSFILHVTYHNRCLLACY